jgi:hypothetical protein
MLDSLWNAGATATYLIGHDHQMAIAQLLDVVIHNTMLQAENLFDCVDFFVLAELFGVGITHIEQLSTKWEDAIQITTNDTQTRNGKRLGTVSFGKNQSALVAISCSLQPTNQSINQSSK